MLIDGVVDVVQLRLVAKVVMKSYPAAKMPRQETTPSFIYEKCRGLCYRM